MDPIGRFALVALDCPDPLALAGFCTDVTGWPVDYADDDWVQLRGDGGATIAFQLAPGHRPPVWPGDEHPQQAHIDFYVDDLDTAEARTLAAGAHKTEFQPGDTFRVYLDPAGHPFCLVLDPALR